MKILFIATFSGLSGATYSLIDTIINLRNKGIKSFVVIPKSGPIEKLLKENQISYKKIRLFNWIVPIDMKDQLIDKMKWGIKRTINSLQEIRILSLIYIKKIDIVHVNAITASWGTTASKISRKPLVWHIREFLEEDLNKTFRNRKKSYKKVRNADRLIAISNSVQEKYQVISPKNIITIYNGINRKGLNYKPKDLFSNDKVTFTLAGRITAKKGHEEVIEAINLVNQAGYNNVVVDFVGSEVEKGYKNKLVTKINKYNLEDIIFFKGYKNDMDKVWEESDVAIVSSTAEAFGRVTVEAMMNENLVIGANSKGTAEIIQNKYGLLYIQGNYNSLANQIIYVLENTKDIKKVIRKSSQYAFNNFTSEINSQKLLNTYTELIQPISKG